MKAENRIDLNIDNKGKGRRFESRFLQAGLVKYSFGVCLLSKEVIDRFAYKFVGCPVIIDHKDITDENAKDERVGVISKVWFNEYDGWFWCEGVVFDDEAISLIKDKGYNVSCQYNIDDYTENSAKALHNGNPYDITILDGTPEHLAIVKNPRYEEALIAVNKGEDMKAENTEFRTGYDSEGDAYVYPLDGADDKKSDKKTDKKEDKKDSGYKIPDDYKKSVKDYTKEQHEKAVDEYGEKMAKSARKANAGIGKDDNGNQYKTYLAQFEEYKALKDYHEQQATKSEDKKEGKKESNVAETKILAGGVKESKDEHGRTIFSKKDSNKRVKIHKNGNYYLASYGQELKDDDGYTEFQVFPSASGKSFKTEEGARKWALKQLNASNSVEEFETELERFIKLVAKNFDESKHKRDEDGKFTDSSNFSGKSIDEQEKELVKELKRLEKNGQDVSDIYKKLTGKEWTKKENKKDKKDSQKSQKSDSVKFDKIGKVLPSILKDMEKVYKESK